MSTIRDKRRGGVAVGLAAGLALLSAAVSSYWVAGGTALLDTVGGSLEAIARTRTPAAIALGLTTVAAKLAAAALALALWRTRPGRWRQRLVVVPAGLAASVLVLWGGLNVLVGGAVLAGALDPGGPVDRWALTWHVALWDLWFVVWGVALAIAIRRTRSHEVTSDTRIRTALGRDDHARE